MGASAWLPPLLAFALARATTHDLFVDGAPPPIVATLPLLIDGAREAVELAVREGDDVAALLGAVTPRLSADNVDQVTSALYLRAAKGGHTVARRWWAVAASAAGPATAAAARAAVWRTALSAAAASRPGAGVVVATDGFALGEESRAALGAALRARGARAAAAVSTAEWVGPSAILAAAVAAAPDRAIVAAPPWGAAVHGDVFVDYERLARGHGRGGRLVAWAAAPAGCLARTPLLVADAESWKALGAPDAGYALEGGVAAWLDDLGARGDAVEVPAWSEALACDPLPDGGERLDAVGLPDDWERLRQIDADLFHLRSRPAGGGRGAAPRPAPTWLGRNLTGLSLDRHERDVRGERGHAVAASLCLYDDDRFLAPLLADLEPRVHAVVVHHALEPWFGAPRPAARRRAAAAVAALAAASAKMSVVVGDWPTEEAQRNSALRVAAALPCAPSHVLLVDGDEFWHPVELDRALALVADAERGGRRVGWARAAMATYFKSASSVVDPPEPLQILWLVETDRGSPTACAFSEARNWACADGTLAADALAAKIDALGVFVDAATARCHHLSYVRTSSELEAKVASFAHARDVVDGWVDDVWRAYDADPALEDLHPTHPAAFKRTKRQPLWALPPALRRLSLDARRRSRDCAAPSGDDALFCHASPPRRAALDLGAPPAAHDRSDGAAAAAAVDVGGDAARTWRPNGPRGRFESVVGGAEAAAAGVQLDPSPGAPTCGAGGRPRFLVVVIGEGELDGATEGVFADAAAAVAAAARALGGDAAAAWCPDARFCVLDEPRPLLIVLGVHHLARYAFEADDGSELSFAAARGWPAPNASALYNFEQVGRAEDLAADSKLLDLLPAWADAGHLWDYSAATVGAANARDAPDVEGSSLVLDERASLGGRVDACVPRNARARRARVDAASDRPVSQANVVALAEARGLRAAHVPLGAAPGLGDGAENLYGPRPVDVLFVGKLNGRRRAALRALRSDHGLRVLHGNADGPLFGEPLRKALEGAKVVLSLRFFDDDREWKMTRFLPAVAAGAVVVAEPGGAPAEQAAWAGAVHFAAGGVSGLARAIQAYLDDDAARGARAEAALDVLRSRPMAAKLRRPLAKLARGACPGWVPETVEGDPAPWQWDVVMD